MAYAMTKQGSLDNCITYEFICDTIEDMNSIENGYRTIGTVAIVLSGTSGLEVYIAGSDKQWNSLGAVGANSGSSGSETIVIDGGGFSIHICSSSEIRFGRPNISAPDEKTIYLVPAADASSGNLYDEYIYVNNKWEKFGSGGNIDLSDYVTYQDLDNADFATHYDLNDYASLDNNGKIPMEQLPIPSITSADDGKVLRVASGEWSVENIGIDNKIDKNYNIDFEQIKWNISLSRLGRYIWTDGDNIYYSYSSIQEVFDKSTLTWSSKIWKKLTNFYGNSIWTDGENIYYSNSLTQYILDKSTSTWSVKTWNGLANFNGTYIWKDGENIYYSEGTKQYILDKTTSTWSLKTWNKLTNFNGSGIWTDGNNIYYSNTSAQLYILDKSTSTWNFYSYGVVSSGNNVWTDEKNIYYSEGSYQYILNKSEFRWYVKVWGGLTNFNGNDIWTDGNNIYYSNSDKQYILPLSQKKILIGTNGEFNSVTNINDFLDDYAPIADPNFTGSISLGRASESIKGEYSIAIGPRSVASKIGGSAFGSGANAGGNYSHAEGASTASGDYSHAEGYNTQASKDNSHTEGKETLANGEQSHAEGRATRATGQSSHAEGEGYRYYKITVNNVQYEGSGAYGNYSHSEGMRTYALGKSSHAEGEYTVATGNDSHVGGRYNYIDEYDNTWQVYQEGITYNVGAKVIYNNDGFICTTEHTSQAFNYSYWTQSDAYKYIEIVGNGAADDARSNARALDWNGNEYLMGDLYVGCNANSTSGTKVATVDDVPLIETHPNNIKIKSLGNVNVNNKNPILRDRSSFDFSKFQSGPAILTIGELTYNINGIFTSQVDGTAIAGIENQYISQELNNDGSNHLINIIQYSGETTVSINAYTPDSSITPSSNTASLTFISDYKLTSTANAIYINTEADGTGGEKVATETYVDTKVPNPPSTDGTYILQATVTNGTPTYSWISAG